MESWLRLCAVPFELPCHDRQRQQNNAKHFRDSLDGQHKDSRVCVRVHWPRNADLLRETAWAPTASSG